MDAITDFRRDPYATQLGLDAEYATGVPGWRFTCSGDRRLESSRVHFTAFARMSDFELVNFYGFGNNTSSNATSDAFRVDQRQWQFRPAVAFALGRRESDISLGPVVQYSTTPANAGRLIARPATVRLWQRSGRQAFVWVYATIRATTCAVRRRASSWT